MRHPWSWKGKSKWGMMKDVWAPPSATFSSRSPVLNYGRTGREGGGAKSSRGVPSDAKMPERGSGGRCFSFVKSCFVLQCPCAIYLLFVFHWVVVCLLFGGYFFAIQLFTFLLSWHCICNTLNSHNYESRNQNCLICKNLPFYVWRLWRNVV